MASTGNDYDQIREGMTVVDLGGAHVGTVKEIVGEMPMAVGGRESDPRVVPAEHQGPEREEKGECGQPDGQAIAQLRIHRPDSSRGSGRFESGESLNDGRGGAGSPA